MAGKRRIRRTGKRATKADMRRAGKRAIARLQRDTLGRLLPRKG